MLEGEACFNELDPSRNPVLSLDEDYTLRFHSDTLHDETLFELPDKLEDTGGIEASDVSSLLAQFEEAEDNSNSTQRQLETPTETCVQGSMDSSNIKLSDDVIRKIRALKEKKKSTIMLPMGMPSKRGRGSAVAMHSSSASLKLQKIMASNLNENSKIKLETYIPNKASSSSSSSSSLVENSNSVCVNYYRDIPEHDYCQNVPKQEKPSVSIDYSETDVLDLEDTETWSDKENTDENNDSGIHTSFTSNPDKKRSKSSNKRTYRKREREESPEIETGNYFDKIPSYYTALSSQHGKKVKFNAAGKKVITIEDYLQQNPIPYRDPSAYNKLPAYYSCFTNSTKYDVTETKEMESSQDSKSSGYSSIPSAYRSRSPSPTYERSESRSRSRVRYNSGPRGRRRGRSERCSSYSSADSRSSSKCSMCSSRSRSRSRTRCLSRDSYSTDSSYSRSRSRSRSPGYRQTSRSRSRERRRQERQKEREERKRQQIEERRIIYVGKVPNNYTRKKLHTRFARFGEIEEVSLHFREHGDNYGFVTFLYTCDAYAAIEKGNTIPGEEHFDLCFGGRRQFCETEYADLDGNAEMEEEFNPFPSSADPFDFDALLKQAKNKIGKR